MAPIIHLSLQMKGVALVTRTVIYRYNMHYNWTAKKVDSEDEWARQRPEIATDIHLHLVFDRIIAPVLKNWMVALLCFNPKATLWHKQNLCALLVGVCVYTCIELSTSKFWSSTIFSQNFHTIPMQKSSVLGFLDVKSRASIVLAKIFARQKLNT